MKFASASRNVRFATPWGAASHFSGWVRGSRSRIGSRSEEHTSELQSQSNLVCRLLLEKKKTLSPRTNWIQNLVDPREATTMHVFILVRGLIRIRMLDHAASRLVFENDPTTVTPFQTTA